MLSAWCDRWCWLQKIPSKIYSPQPLVCRPTDPLFCWPWQPVLTKNCSSYRQHCSLRMNVIMEDTHYQQWQCYVSLLASCFSRKSRSNGD